MTRYKSFFRTYGSWEHAGTTWEQFESAQEGSVDLSTLCEMGSEDMGAENHISYLMMQGFKAEPILERADGSLKVMYVKEVQDE